MQKIVELRADGVPVFFTIDAGPQVKAICLPEHEATVVNAMSSVSGVEAVLTSGIGAGAALVSDT